MKLTVYTDYTLRVLMYLSLRHESGALTTIDEIATAYDISRSHLMKIVHQMGAAGLLSLQVCGFYEDPTVKGSANWLLNLKPTWETDWFFYGTYYYAQGMFQCGDRYADHARELVQSILLGHQEREGDHAGSWDPHFGQERDAGRVYATSLAILSLSVKYHYLPIYQR